MYSSDYDETILPPALGSTGGQDWMDLLVPYSKAKDILVCPSAPASHYFCSTQGLPETNWAGGCASVSKLRATYAINNVYYNTTNPVSGQDEWVFQTPPIVLSKLESTANTIFAGDAMAWGSGNNYQVSGVAVQNLAGLPAIGWGGAQGGSGQGQFVARHSQGFNFVLFDGHVKWFNMGTALQKAANGYYYYFARTQSY